jgi:Fe2+ or Zn2+ uptake regulation protein
MANCRLKERLREKGLKVTSRRIAILEAIIELNHPTAEQIINFIRAGNPSISTATVYKALNILVQRQVINKVNTDQDITRYDALPESHHHLYFPEINRLQNYDDENLSEIIRKYLKKKKIPGFRVEGFNLLITGKFTNNKNNTLKKIKNGKEKANKRI